MVEISKEQIDFKELENKINENSMGKEWKEARKIVEKYGPAFLKHAQWKPNDIPPGC